MQLQLVDIIGFAASGFVFLTFYMQTLLPLRLVAIVSNVFFIAYSIAAGLIPILVLHVLLLPMNILRAYQQLQSRKRIREALKEAPDSKILIPFMTTMTCADGDVIFNLGDIADRLFVVLEGALIAVEIGKTIPKGAIFGEIGLFSLEATRMATVRANGPATIGWVDRQTIIRIFQDHPDFALGLTKLITARLTENHNDLRAQHQPAT